MYCHSPALTNKGSFVDHGANGGLCGTDVRISEKTGRSVDIQGIDNYQITDVHIVTDGTCFYTERGLVVIILHLYAYISYGKITHSSGKLKSFNCDVNDKSMKVPCGLQCITTQEDVTIHLDIIYGLPYVDIRHYTDKEWKSLPHVIITLDIIWDHTILNNII